MLHSSWQPSLGSVAGMELSSQRKQISILSNSVWSCNVLHVCFFCYWLVCASCNLGSFAIAASMDLSVNTDGVLGSFPSLEALLAEDANNYLQNRTAMRIKMPAVSQTKSLGDFDNINKDTHSDAHATAAEAYRRKRMRRRGGGTLVSDDPLNTHEEGTMGTKVLSHGDVEKGQVILEPQHLSEVEVAAKNVGQLVAGMGGLAVGAALASSMPLSSPYGAMAYGGFNPYMQQLDCAIPGDFPGTCSVTNTEFVLIILAVVLVLMAFCAGICFVAFKQWKK